MTALLVALAAVVVAAAGLVACDRALAGLAERRATQYAGISLGRDAVVRVHGSPFLTQALRGRYGDVEITATGLAVGVFSGCALHAHLLNALLPLRALVRGTASELPIEHAHGEVVLPYEQLARISRVPGLRLQFRGDRLHATASLPVPGLGQLAQVGGEAIGSIDAAGAVWLRVRNLSVAGISLPGRVLSQLVPALTFPILLPPLPYGIRIDQLVPTAEGLQVSGSARAVVLRAAPAAAADLTG